MTRKQFGSRALSGAVCLGIIAGLSVQSPRVLADDNEDSLSQIGLSIAPVKLNLAGKDQNLVGLGSFIVNAQADCNGCHNGGTPPNFNYAAGGNPYFEQKTMVDPKVYLSGGMDFGPVGTPTPNGAPGKFYAGPDIITRNLTPNKYGVPEGGMSLAHFKDIMRNGPDYDHIHPTCTKKQIGDIQNGATPVCIPTSPGNTPDGNLLQVMPWPVFSHMTDHQLEAIYEYLSAIPCIDNTFSPPPAGAPNELRNDCGK